MTNAAPVAACLCLLLSGALATAGVRGQDLVWRPHQFGSHREFDLTFDEARGRAVAFSGGRTLEWDLVDWRQRPTANRPASRFGHRMVFDTVRQRVLLWGGSTASGYDGALWQYDGADWTVRTLPGPTPRIDHALAFDEARGRAVVYGGHTSTGGNLTDTWEWDGSQWHNRTTAGPGVRIEVAMAWHPGTGLTILFGGADNTQPRNDTWSWDGTTWLRLNPATVPPRRANHRIALDRGRGCLVMFGGPDPDTWEWWGNDWVRGPAGPPMRVGFGLAAEGTGRTLMLGGATTPITTFESVTLGDTWAYDGIQWLRVGRGGPTARASFALSYDDLRDRVVLFGGGDALTSPTHTWEWNGTTWTEIVAATEPPHLNLTAMAFDRARARTVLFGGMFGFLAAQDQTWLWDGANWTLANVTNPPPARWDHAMAYDAGRARVVLFGGRGLAGNLGDTWEWDGAQWRQASASGPSPRSAPAMTHDAGRGRTVLFGGLAGNPASTVVRDTWEWDGAAWLLRAPATQPPARAYAAMAYDAGAARSVLLTGFNGVGGDYDDVWEWDGNDWRQTGRTFPGRAHRVVYRSAGDHLLQLVGTPSGTMLTSNDLWLGSRRLAQTAPVGSGCGAATPPILLPFGEPVPGRPAFGVDVLRAPAGAAVLLGLASGSGSVPLGAGCAVHLQGAAATVAAIATAGGFAPFRLPVPANPALTGVELFCQAGALDASAPLGIALTAALRLLLGE